MWQRVFGKKDKKILKCKLVFIRKFYRNNNNSDVPKRNAVGPNNSTYANTKSHNAGYLKKLITTRTQRSTDTY